MRSINHSSFFYQYVINNLCSLCIHMKAWIISIFKHERRRVERWRDEHNQDIKKIKENIPIFQKWSSMFLFFCLQDFTFSSIFVAIGIFSIFTLKWQSCFFFNGVLDKMEGQQVVNTRLLYSHALDHVRCMQIYPKLSKSIATDKHVLQNNKDIIENIYIYIYRE